MHLPNILKLLLLLSILMLRDMTVSGQNKFGIKASGGLSRITNSIDISNVTLTTPFVPSECNCRWSVRNR